LDKNSQEYEIFNPFDPRNRVLPLDDKIHTEEEIAIMVLFMRIDGIPPLLIDKIVDEMRNTYSGKADIPFPWPEDYNASNTGPDNVPLTEI